VLSRCRIPSRSRIPRWDFNVAIAVALSDARKKSVRLTIAIVPAVTSFPAVSGNSVMPSLGSNLLRPVELGSIDPHAMQNDGEVTGDRGLRLAEPIALGEPYPQAFTAVHFGTRVSRTPAASNDNFAASRRRTSRCGLSNRPLQKHRVCWLARRKHLRFSTAQTGSDRQSLS
jgi:hypothetical protein